MVNDLEGIHLHLSLTKLKVLKEKTDWIKFKPC